MSYKDIGAQREYQRRWVASKRARWLKEHGPCCECGSWDDLELHHTDPATKVEHRIWSWTQERLANEARKCTVLCSRCHRRRTNATLRPLSLEQARDIRVAYGLGEASQRGLAVRYGVPRRTIQGILAGERYNEDRETG